MSVRSELTERIAALPGIVAKKSRFSENLAFYSGGREIAHFHDGGELDVRLTRKVIRELASGDPDIPITVRKSSDWSAIRFSRRSDIALVLSLVERAVSANCAS